MKVVATNQESTQNNGRAGFMNSRLAQEGERLNVLDLPPVQATAILISNETNAAIPIEIRRSDAQNRLLGEPIRMTIPQAAAGNTMTLELRVLPGMENVSFIVPEGIRMEGRTSTIRVENPNSPQFGQTIEVPHVRFSRSED